MILLAQPDGKTLAFDSPCDEIVSLVPCITEALILFGKKPVGRTSFCTEPHREVQNIPVVGGTKTPKIGKIVDCHPDLVIANQEENRKEDVEELLRAGLNVWVTYPRTVADVVPYLLELARVSGTEEKALPMIENIRTSIDEIRASVSPVKRRIVILIWKDPWMAVGEETYMNDLIATVGGVNPLANCSGRYPVITAEEIVESRPDLLLLPSEPYRFRDADLQEWEKLLGSQCQVVLVNGEDFTWFGPRTPRSLVQLSQFSAEGLKKCGAEGVTNR